MTDAVHTSLECFLSLERAVWRALQTGDGSADTALLSERFLGVYPSGLSDRSGHAAQLHQGPSVLSYRLSECQLVEVADGACLLVYRADYRRISSAIDEAMWVSSLWQKQHDNWQCLFSQDTPIELKD